MGTLAEASGPLHFSVDGSIPRVAALRLRKDRPLSVLAVVHALPRAAFDGASRIAGGVRRTSMSESGLPCDPEDLVRVVRTPMPFGRYQGRPLIDLPDAYLVWFEQRGYPRGRLGDLMRLALEIRTNGLMHLVDPLRDDRPAGEVSS